MHNFLFKILNPSQFIETFNVIMFDMSDTPTLVEKI